MSETVFRAAKATEPNNSTPPSTPTAKDNTSTAVVVEDSLVYTYEQENGHPYTAKYLGIADVYDADLFGQEVGEVEAYLKQQVTDKLLDNSVDAAKLLLKKLEKQAGIEPTEPTNAKLNKLSAYVRFKSEVRKHEQDRKKWTSDSAQ